MTECKHTELALISEKSVKLRCNHCHLTIAEDELGDGYCPECYEEKGKKHKDFEKIETQKPGIVKYRCEKCGIYIECE